MNTLILRGLGQLAVDGVSGVSTIAERLHAVIAQRATLDFSAPQRRTRGITGLVYRSVRGVSSVVGGGVDLLLRSAAPAHWQGEGNAAERQLRAVLNGVLGDHLAATANPLALPMQLRHAGQPMPLVEESLAGILGSNGSKEQPRIMLLIHGLCMGPDQWQREGIDHAAALASELGYLPLHLEYNSGLPIHCNGAALSALLEQLLDQLPQPPERIVIVAHSMGGLVARSACAQASAAQRWPQLLREMVFLGTPHLGAPLEQAGSVVDRLLRISPYSAPFALLGTARSAGIQDLRRGQFLPPQPGEGSATAGAPELPRDLRCHAVAASLKQADSVAARHLLGDGLVPVRSALAEDGSADRALPLADSSKLVIENAGHFDLLGDARVYTRLRHWLTAASGMG